MSLYERSALSHCFCHFEPAFPRQDPARKPAGTMAVVLKVHLVEGNESHGGRFLDSSQTIGWQALARCQCSADTDLPLPPHPSTLSYCKDASCFNWHSSSGSSPLKLVTSFA